MLQRCTSVRWLDHSMKSSPAIGAPHWTQWSLENKSNTHFPRAFIIYTHTRMILSFYLKFWLLLKSSKCAIILGRDLNHFCSKVNQNGFSWIWLYLAYKLTLWLTWWRHGLTTGPEVWGDVVNEHPDHFSGFRKNKITLLNSKTTHFRF